MELLIRNAKVYHEHSFWDSDVYICNGKIDRIEKNIICSETCAVLDAGGRKLIPGFIDIHTHGAAGADVNKATSQELNEVIGAFFASQGTTSWLASILTDTPQQTLYCIEQVNAASQKTGNHAQLLGVHLEGPFLSQEYKGAMPQELLSTADLDLFRKYYEASKGNMRYITVSPEVEGVEKMISEISQDVAVAVGHSGADYESAMACIRAGARACTHTFNAMKLFHQHNPGIMGAVLESNVYCETICDGKHLHPAAVRLLTKCKGLHRVIAVTDSIMAAGLCDGKYKLGVNDIEVKNGDAKLQGTDVRAGSTLTMIQAFKNLIEFTGRPMEQIIPTLTENPATLLGIEKRKGYICAGYDADLLLLNDDFTVYKTFVGGYTVYSAS